MPLLLPHTFQRASLTPMNTAVNDLSSHTPIVLGYLVAFGVAPRVSWL